MTQTNISFRNYHQFALVGLSRRYDRSPESYTASIAVVVHLHLIVEFDSKFLDIRRVAIFEWIFVSFLFARLSFVLLRFVVSR